MGQDFCPSRKRHGIRARSKTVTLIDVEDRETLEEADAPGCRETVIDGENGFLVPPRDTKALEQAMERVIADPGLIEAMGLRSRRLAESKYDVREVNRAMMGLLELPETGR